MAELGQSAPRRGLLDRPITLTGDHWVFLMVVAAMTWSIIAPTVAPSLAVISIGPISFYTYDILIVIVAALTLSAALAELRDPHVTIHRAVVVAAILYLAYQLAVILPIAVVRTNEPIYTVLRTVSPRFLLIYVLYFYLRGLRVVSSGFIVRVINIAAIGLVIYAAGRYAIQGPVGYSAGSEYRLRQVEGGAALFFGWLIITRFFLYRVTLMNWVIILAGAVGIVLVNYRMAYLGLAATFFVLLVGTGRGLRRLPVAILLVSLVLLAITMAPATIRDNAIYSVTRVVDPKTTTSVDRLERYGAGLDYFRAHPFGDFAVSGRNYLVDFGSAPGQNHEPHNFVVQILSQQGLVAFGFFAFIIGAVLLVGFRNRRRDIASAVALGYLVFYLVFCSFTTSFFGEANAPFFALPVSMILWRDVVLRRCDDGESDGGLHERGTAPVGQAGRHT